jgi:LppX/LprAFG-like lipoprotein
MNALISQANTHHRQLSRRPIRSASGAILIAAGLFATFVTGCGSESQTSETTEATETTAAAGTTTATSEAAADATPIVQESARTTETLRTVHLDLTATGLPKLPVESVNADVSSEVQGNGQAIGNAKFRATPEAPFVDTDFLVTNKTFYTKAEDGTWTERGPADKIYDPGIILDRERGAANVIRSVQNPKPDGKETIDGVATVKVSGTIDAAVIDPLVPTLGEGGGALPITLYIVDVGPPGATPTTSLPSEAPSPGAGGPNLVRMVVTKDQGSVDVTLSNWAKPVNIPSPTG